jgi:hypothetical protein
MDSGGSSYYNGMQTRLEKRFSRGLTLLHAFTYTRGIENVGAWNDPNGSLTPQNAYDFRAEKALAGNPVKFNSVINWVYYLPFGKGQARMSNASAGHECCAWELGVRRHLQLALRAAGDDHQQFLRRELQHGRPALHPRRRRSRCQRFDRQPHRHTLVQQGCVRRAGGPVWNRRQEHRLGPGTAAVDLTTAKRFRFGEERSLQFRAELFNAFNHVNYNPPDGNVSNATFGRITSALAGLGVQFGLKFYW